MLASVIGFLVILAPLVIVHEFGHFFFAKLFGVKAEVFSVGFGPRIFGRKFGETEFRFSIFPLGGYVKLLGEDRDQPLSPEERKRALHAQAAWKRFFIFLGGPLFNFLWAILVFMAILALGEPQIASVIARVMPESPAEQLGFRNDDRVTAVDGRAINKFEDLLTAIHDSPNKTLVLNLNRGAAKAVLKVTPQARSGYSQYGEEALVGEIDGLLPMARTGAVGISDPASPAAKAGLTTGDLLLALNGEPLRNWEALEAAWAALPNGKSVTFKVQNAVRGTASEVAFTKTETLAQLGLRSSELFIDKIVPSSPAEKSGMKNGDRLVSIGGVEVKSFYQLKDLVQKGGEAKNPVIVRWERAGQMQDASLIPSATEGRDPVLKRTTLYTIGVVPMLMLAEPETVSERVVNPFSLIYLGTERMISFSWRNFVSVGKMFTGDVSVSTLGGPIMIGKIAGESLTRGLHSFLLTMAVLSIGLGVLNVLPVPVLDGGHLVLLGIEVIRGKPLSLRQMEVVQQVGLSLILILMVIVIRNDLSRISLFQ